METKMSSTQPGLDPYSHGSIPSALSNTTFEAIIRIAELAGDAIMQVYERGADAVDSNVSTKDDNSPLTEADLAAHHVIVDALNALTPDIAVVSEEDASSLVHRTDKNTFWLIDPLDGTKEFIARNGEFTVNIALIVSGEPGWGVVHAPALQLTYWGGQSFGAFKQDHMAGTTRNNLSDSSNDNPGQTATTRLAVSSVLAHSLGGGLGAGSRNDRSVQAKTDTDINIKANSHSLVRVVASKSHLNQETEDFIKRLGIVELVQAGSSLKLCKIAEGSADIYPRLAPTCEWDTAAAQAVVEGAGGYVFDTEGNRLRYGKTELLNPSFIACAIDHHGLQAILQVSE
jgi:3'(2'), 5'-bisphosphate nucleotidase